MKTKSLNEIAAAWIRLNSSPKQSSEYKDSFWAHEALDSDINEEPDRALDIIEAVRALDCSDHILANLAAGPMEDLLVRRGAEIIERIENIAQRDRVMRKLLGAVWEGAIENSVWKRVQKLADKSW